MYKISKICGCHMVEYYILNDIDLEDFEMKDGNVINLIWFSTILSCDCE